MSVTQDAGAQVPAQTPSASKDRSHPRRVALWAVLIGLLVAIAVGLALIFTSQSVGSSQGSGSAQAPASQPSVAIAPSQNLNTPDTSVKAILPRPTTITDYAGWVSYLESVRLNALQTHNVTELGLYFFNRQVNYVTDVGPEAGITQSAYTVEEQAMSTDATSVSAYTVSQIELSAPYKTGHAAVPESFSAHFVITTPGFAGHQATVLYGLSGNTWKVLFFHSNS